jgi:glucosyl-dolichyl phosphate glucuronosyltransferase
MKPQKISVIICTYNRKAYLKKCLDSLKKQTTKYNYEVIVIDNNSKENTRRIVHSYKKYNRISYFLEKRQGLSQARNLGIKKSSGEIIAFMDDDAIAENNWLEKILISFEKDKRIGAVGGKIIPIFETNKPRWLDKRIEFLISAKTDDNKKFLKKENLFGTNMAFKKDIIEIGFEEDLGRKADLLISGEESLLQDILKKRGFLIFYNPDIIVKHFISKERLTKEWFEKRAIAEGKTNAFLCLKQKSKYSLQKNILKNVLCLVLNPLLLIIQLFDPDNSFLCYQKIIGIIRINELKTLLRGEING